MRLGTHVVNKQAELANLNVGRKVHEVLPLCLALGVVRRLITSRDSKKDVGREVLALLRYALTLCVGHLWVWHDPVITPKAVGMGHTLWPVQSPRPNSRASAATASAGWETS